MKLPIESRFKNGFSLIEVLVTLGIMSVAGLALTNLNVTGMKANKSNQLRADLEDVRRTITNSIGCDQTLGLRRPSTCLGPQVLKDRLNRDLAPDKKIGSWTIEATCESIGTPAKMGLSIYATKPLGRGLYAKDPLRNLNLDKQHPRSSLFDPAARLCSGSFSTPGFKNCPFGVLNIAFQDGDYNCAPNPWESRVASLERADVEIIYKTLDSNNPQSLQSQINALKAQFASPAWPSGPYCIVQAKDRGCPTGFNVINPNSCLGQGGGGPLGAECHLLRGGDSSVTNTEIMGMGMNKMKNAQVVRWAWCCK